MKYLLTTVPGLEDIVVQELREKLNYKVDAATKTGKVIVTIPFELEPSFKKIARQLKSCERIVMILGMGQVNDIGEVKSFCKSIFSMYKIDKGLIQHFYLAVRSKRIGEHNFTSIDISRAVGDAITEYAYEKWGLKPSFSLDNPDITIYAELTEDRFLLGVDITGIRSLRDRGYKIYVHPSSLNPIIAYSMARIAGVKTGQRILDPMCGSGTILIECGLEWRGLELYGADIDPRHLEGAKLNAEKAGLKDKIKFILCDATELHECFPTKFFDVILSNLPYGIRIKTSGDISVLYRRFLTSAKRVLKDEGVMVLLTARKGTLKRAVKSLGFRIASIRIIEQGGLRSGIFLIRP